jgi:hypothetical protein
VPTIHELFGVPMISLRFMLPLVRIRRALVISLIPLIALDFIASYLAGTKRLGTLARFFDGDVKTNFPSSYKILAMLASSALLWLTSRASNVERDGLYQYWRVLTVVFVFLTLDEMIYLHQAISAFLHKHVGGSGYLHYSWQVPYLIAAALLTVYFIPLLRRLQNRFRVGVLAAAVLFAGGSGGLEFIKSQLDSVSGSNETLRFKLVSAFSDSAEMLGLTVLVLTLLAYLTGRVSDLRLQATPSAEVSGSQQ